MNLTIRYKDGAGDTSDTTKLVTYSKAKIGTPNVVVAVSPSAQSISSNLTIASISVTGTGIVWYASAANAASGTNPLPSTTLLINTTYYATQTIGGCTSTTSLAVTVTTLANIDFESVKFNYYPNPVFDQLFITADKEINSIESSKRKYLLKSESKKLNNSSFWSKTILSSNCIFF